ncbi:MAG: hypothetical protein CEE43_12305 [Promethearchaeota archaeon Loki_b32]|nr:MAG: hypothetical protein CEE43_12305 [Candidatus Lokiarchaeota archaeon Loki_b32]
MIRLTIRQALLLKVFRDYDGFNGKINIQKIIYAFQVAKIMNLHYIFRSGSFGPFSEELEQDLNQLCEVGLLIEEPYGRIRVNDNLINNSFFHKYRDFFKLFEKNKILEYKIVDVFENDLQTSMRIELAMSFIYLILSKDFRMKKDFFKAIDRWKPGDFDNDEKEDVWTILIQNNFISESGDLRFPIKKNNHTQEILEEYIFIENTELESLDNITGVIRFDEMLENVYHDSFWRDLISSIIDKTECKYWDFKETLDIWQSPKSLKKKRQIDFCEKVAAFANKKGGLIIIGITDKFPRRIIGINNLEDKIQSISTILDKWIDYQENYFEIMEIILKDSEDIKRRCIAIMIAQTKDPVGVMKFKDLYSYPVRVETGLNRETFSRLSRKKRIIDNTNFNFLKILNKNGQFNSL